MTMQHAPSRKPSSVPWGAAERSADPERTTTPVEYILSGALVVGSVLGVLLYLAIASFVAR